MSKTNFIDEMLQEIEAKEEKMQFSYADKAQMSWLLFSSLHLTTRSNAFPAYNCFRHSTTVPG